MPKLIYMPLTPDRWPDLEALFGSKGAYGGCWCMWWRLKRSEFEKGQGESNRKAFRKIVKKGKEPGLLAYDGNQAVGWCAVAPRDEYSTIRRSRIIRPIDDKPVWSVVCLYVARGQRGRGVARGLVRAAVRYVREHGGWIVEAYPTVPRTGHLPEMSAFMGTPDLFASAGFREVARPSEARMIMRKYIR